QKSLRSNRLRGPGARARGSVAGRKRPMGFHGRLATGSRPTSDFLVLLGGNPAPFAFVAEQLHGARLKHVDPASNPQEQAEKPESDLDQLYDESGKTRQDLRWRRLREL